MRMQLLLLSGILALLLAAEVPRAGVALLTTAFLLLAFPAMAVEAAPQDEINKLPLNTAEVLLEIDKSEFTGRALTPHTTFENAYFVGFSATDELKEKARCRISRSFDALSCDGYDTLIFFAQQEFRPQRVTMEVTTDAGTLENTDVSEPVGESTSNFSYMELPVDLGSAQQITEIAITFEADEPGRGSWKNYWGFLSLRDSRRFQDHLAYWETIRDIDWGKYLDDPDRFEDAAHLTFAPGELELYREYVETELPAYRSRIKDGIERAKRYCRSICEADISSSNSQKHIRKRAAHSPIGELALYGVLLENKEALRWAGRCALAQAAYESWRRQYWINRWRFHGPHVFQVAYVARSLSTATSLCSSALNRKGLEFVLYGLLDKGYKDAMHSLWARAYAFEMNQAAVFLMGKVFPLLLFERHWPRVEPYTDIALAELNENMDNLFRPDGGYTESTGYMDYTIACALPSYMAYSAARDLPITQIMAENVKKSAGFGEIIYSTNRNPRRNVVSFGETRTLSFDAPDRTLFMAAACPGTIWERFVDPDALKGEVLRPELWRLSRQVSATGEVPPLTPFTEIPSIGAVNAFRETASGGASKVLFMGYAPMGKREEDVGKFIVEYDGDSYADGLTGRVAPFYATAEFQNLLIPTGTGSAPHPVRYSTLTRKGLTFIPDATGDERAFTASMANLGDSWDEEYFRGWKRTINSPTPETITITDDYELGHRPTGVDFTWVTTLPAEVKGDAVVITGDYGSRCELTWNEGCTASVERFSPADAVYEGMFIDEGREFSRIRIHREGKEGVVIVNVKLSSGP